VIEDGLRFGADGMIMIASRDGHQLGGFAGADALNELLNAEGRKDVERCLDPAVDLVPNKDIHDRSAQSDDGGKLVLGLFGGVMDLKDPLGKGGGLQDIAVVG